MFLRASGIFINFNDVHPSNADDSKTDTESGISIETKEVQFLKALDGIIFIESLKETFSNEAQPLKTDSPNASTLLGIVIDFNKGEDENAYEFTYFTDSEIVTFLRESHSEKANDPIRVMVLGIFTSVKYLLVLNAEDRISVTAYSVP